MMMTKFSSSSITFLTYLMLVLQGKRRECLDDPPTEDDIFGPQHYGELGFIRDVCVALGRDLIRTLQLTDDAIKPCQELALTRTSTCWPFQDCKKWKWNDKKNKKAFGTVSSRALKMVEHFNNNVSKYPVLCGMADQKFIWKSVDTAVSRLIKSGAVAANSDLIAGIYKLRSNYCRTYKRITLSDLFQMKDEKEEREALAKNKDQDSEQLVSETEKRLAAQLQEWFQRARPTKAEENLEDFPEMVTEDDIYKSPSRENKLRDGIGFETQENLAREIEKDSGAEDSPGNDTEDDVHRSPSRENELRNSIGFEIQKKFVGETEKDLQEKDSSGSATDDEDDRIPIRGIKQKDIMKPEVREEENRGQFNILPDGMIKTLMERVPGYSTIAATGIPLTIPKRRTEDSNREAGMEAEEDKEHHANSPQNPGMAVCKSQYIEIAGPSSPQEREHEKYTYVPKRRTVTPTTKIKTDRRENDTTMKTADTKSSAAGTTKQEEASGGEQNEKIGELALHESIFRNDSNRVFDILYAYDKYDVTKKDKHGNTALHLAVMLGRRWAVRKLLYHGAAVTIRSRNELGWCPMDEAISYGDEETVKIMLLALTEQTHKDLIKKRRTFLEELITVPDFYMELKWEFTFAVNLLSYFLPADVCKIRKRHNSVRLDWSLVGMGDNNRYKYGHVAVLFDGTALPSPLVYYLNVKKKEFMKIEIEKKEEVTESNAEERAKKVIKADIIYATVSTSKVEYSQVKNWRRSYKTETVGPFVADVYNVKGLALKIKTRTEHRPKKEEEKKENGKDEKQKDKDKADEEKKKEAEEEKPLLPPPLTDVTWEQYIDAEPGKYHSLAREIVEKVKLIPLKENTLAMVQNFPITKEAFVRILEVVAPFKQFNKLREFVEMKLPPGFPVKLDIPIKFGVSAKITVLKIQSSETIANEEIMDEGLFKVPEDYKDLKKKEDTPMSP